jgi:hypothetical protein
MVPSLVFGAGTGAIMVGLSPDAGLVGGGAVGICLASGFYGITELFVLPQGNYAAPAAEVAHVAAPKPVAVEVGGEDADAAQEVVAVGLSPVAIDAGAAADVHPVEKDLLAKITKSHGDGRSVTVNFARADGGVAITIRTVQYGQKTFYSLVNSKVELLKNCGWNVEKDPKNNKVRIITGLISEDRLAEIRAALKEIG